MRIAFLALALATISGLTASALDGTDFVERNGPQFLFAWPDNQRDAAIEAVEALSKSPYMINDVSMDKAAHEQRQQRIVAKARAGMLFYDTHWNLIQPFSLISSDGSMWGIYQFSMPETIMLGLASGWYFCDPSNQDTDNIESAINYCADMTMRSKILNKQVNYSSHMTPGGNSQ